MWTANIYEMHEWIVIHGMPGFLDVCMHGCMNQFTELHNKFQILGGKVMMMMTIMVMTILLFVMMMTSS